MIPFLSFSIHTEDGCCSKKKNARCTGSASCRACSNCSACKWCSSGGTCGVCAGKKKNSSSSYSTPSNNRTSVQCRAITKKGTRCSRTSRSNNYCWQHGG